MMIDTHCHLSNKDYSDINKVIKKMGNNIIIASGADPKYNNELINIIEKYDNVFGTIGIHPDEADNYTKEDIAFIEKNLSNKKIIGIGEIGLDYFHNKENKEKQKDLFIIQLDIARKYNKPVVIHTRDAIMDTYDILKNYKDLKIILHCYSGSLEMAYKFMELNVKFGIGGVVTFKNGKKMQEVVKNIPLEYILLETDSPYLSPEPLRGKINEPYNITIIAQKIAELKNTNIEEIYKKTTQNAKSMYNI